MKKDVISVFDGETKRAATIEEKFAISVFFTLLAPVVVSALAMLLMLALILIFGK